MDSSDQLLDMLTTIQETQDFLRKRCASGQAGQSMALFEDLGSLLELIDSRYRKSGFLPRETPVFSGTPDILSAVRFLDSIDKWREQVTNKIHRRKVRQELARGGILDAAAQDGKPFVQTAVELAQLVRGGPAPSEPPGSPEERVERDPGVQVSFSRGEEEAPGGEPVQSPPPSEPPAPKPFDRKSESDRLFAAVKARTGRNPAQIQQKPNPEPEPPAQPGESAQPAEAPPPEPPEPTGARPMGRSGGARPMGRKAAGPPQSENARPMSKKEPAAGQPTPPSVSAPTPIQGHGIAIDRDFQKMMNELGSVTEEDLEKKLIAAFPKLENRYKMVICDQLRRFRYWGRLEPDRNDFEVLGRRAQELSRHRDEYLWLYGQLSDYRSRKTLLAILDNWYAFNLKDLANMKEKLFSPYLDADLLRCGEAEVFVDMGAGTGEVSKNFSEFTGHWKQIYCYEPNPANLTSLRSRLRALPQVDIRQSAVGDKHGKGFLAQSDDPLYAYLSDKGSEVDIVLPDDDLKGSVSIVKMCLEGGEQAAIRGFSNHIHRDHPKLILRADHGDSDLWQLPRMIERLDKKYHFYLRHYGGNLVPMEYVLYAV